MASRTRRETRRGTRRTPAAVSSRADARPRDRGPRPARSLCTVIGSEHRSSDPNLTFGPYQVCLSDNQRETLFDGRPRDLLGCGVFACAYVAPRPDRVVKITRDSEDVAALIRAGDTGVTPRLHRAFELRQGGRSVTSGAKTRVFAVEVDRVTPLPDDLNTRIALQAAYHVVSTTPGEIRPEEAARKARHDMEREDTECGASCRRLLRETFDVVARLRAAGVDWRDIHPGNLGRDRDGKLVAIDLGITRVELRRDDAQVLAGRMAAAADGLGAAMARLRRSRRRRARG